MPRIFFHAADFGACTYYRAYLPYRHCKEALAERGVTLTIGSDPESAGDCDAYVFARLAPGFLLPVIYDLRATGKRIVWDLDDNLFRVPDWNPAHKMYTPQTLRTLQWCLGIATHVTVSTQPLADFLSLDKTTVLPNLVDASPFSSRLRPIQPPARPNRVLWAGSPTHAKDLEIVVPVVRRLALETPDLHWIFVGEMPPELDQLPADRITHVPGVPLRHYPHLLRLLEPDVALLPLVDCEFNRSKSAIKFYEMTLAGAAVVASNVGPYAAEIDGGRTGLLVTDDPDEWIDAIAVAATRADAETLRHQAAQKVRGSHAWQSERRNVWIDYLASLVL